MRTGRTPPPVKTASTPSRHAKEAAGKGSPKGPTFDKQTARPEFISYANVNKAAPSGILPTPPKRHSASRLSMGSETGELGPNSPSRAITSRTPTSLDTPLPLTPTAGPAVSDLSEQPGQVSFLYCTSIVHVSATTPLFFLYNNTVSGHSWCHCKGAGGLQEKGQGCCCAQDYGGERRQARLFCKAVQDHLHLWLSCVVTTVCVRWRCTTNQC